MANTSVREEGAPTRWTFPFRDTSTTHRVVLSLGVALAYYVAAKLGLELALVGKNVTPLWPPTGIALVAFLLFGRRVWPGVALAAFVVNEPISTSVVAACVTAAGNTLAPVAAAAVLERVGFRRQLDRLRDAVALIGVALGGMVISASVGTATLVVSDSIPASRLVPAWAVWWTGDAMGVLVVAPFLLSLTTLRKPSLKTWERKLEASALLVSLSLVSFWVLRSDARLLFLVLPLLGWAAWRFQQRGAAPAALLVAAAATWAAAHHSGPWAGGSLFKSMLTLQAFNATVAFTSFYFAAVVTERSRARQALEEALQRQREATERLRALDEMKTTFLSTVSHELRTPITISRGHLEVLREDATADELRAAAAVALDELDRMGRILADITSLIRMEDRALVQLEEVDLSQLAVDVGKKAEPIFRSRLVVRSETEPSYAKVDPQRVTQALLNLLHNAAAHAPTATRVELRLEREPGWWRFEVDDNGEGLPRESEEEFFEAFRKRPRSGGSGLGLAVVRGVAEAHGGSAGVENRPGRGATFWIRVPQ